MAMIAYGYAYCDLEDGVLINTVASSPEEADVNLSMMEIEDDRASRLTLIEVEIYYDMETDQ